MRVVHVDCGCSWRGGQQQVYLLHRGLVADGIDSQLLAPRASDLLRRCRGEGLPADHLNGRRPWHALNPRVEAILRSTTIVHSHDSKAAGIAAVACSRQPGLRWVCHRRLSYGVKAGWIRRIKYRRVGRWIAVSSEIAAVMAGAGVPSHRCTVVDSAIDVDAVRAEADAADLTQVRRDLDLPSGDRVVGMVGALEEQKGHRVLIAAADAILRNHPDTRFVIVGDGRLGGRSRRLAAAHRVDHCFRFLGFRSDVATLMRSFDVLAAPSVDGEGSPAVVKEAMTLGVPVVASDLWAHRELLGTAGVLVPAGSPDALAEGIDAVLSDDGLRRRMTERIQKAAGDFRVETMVAATREVYDHIMEESVRGAQGRS